MYILGGMVVVVSGRDMAIQPYLSAKVPCRCSVTYYNHNPSMYT